MSQTNRSFVAAATPESTWARYVFAVAASAAAVALEFWVDGLAGRPLGPFLSSFAAVIASAVWAGPGPGVLSTAVLLIWAVFDLQHEGAVPPEVILRGAFFSAGGVLLSFGSSRMLRSAKVAAESEAWHRQLVETASEGIWVRDRENVITYANTRMAEMLGVPPDRVTGRKATDFFFPEDHATERIRLESLRSGVKEQFDRRLRRSDGAEIWVLACCNLIPADTGRERALAMMSDITERKRAEQALRQSEARFRNLFEGVLEGVYQSSPDGRILAANPMLLHMLGFSGESELNDIHIARDLYVDPSVRRRLIEQLEHSGSFQNMEYELRTRDGRIITVLENARVIRDSAGSVLYFEGTLTDISERKRIEEQLRRAQKIEAVGRLAGGVAHDFDMVLEVIMRHLDQLRELLPSESPARASADQARQVAEGATALTRQLLSFSKRPEAAPASDDGETILLVEDEPLVRELSRDMLERQGYHVVTATDAGEAERLGNDRTQVFDVLIVELNLPGISGRELARRLRLVHPALRVLFIRGYSDSQSGVDENPPSGVAFLQKPFSAESLTRRIAQIPRPEIRTRSVGT